ncbi:MAG: LLM class flavin-dependent oxidoreductase [Deltaproteobacteria bacterium]|nr:LLM class flavin-dependent oxidoreductase [Deltaproteobacteria bacterium]
MKLDLLYEIDAPKPWTDGPHPYGQRRREQRAYREAIEQIKLADRLGFHTIWAVEHHFREGRSHCPAPEVLLGALSQVTERIRLGFGVTLTPFGFTHPARIAEKVATLDILSNGRAEWGTGRSTPMEQTAFGVDRERSREHWKEAIEIVCGMWRDERFAWDSPNFKFPERVVTPKPFQDPHPPCWMAATSEGSAEVAGANGLGMLSFSIMQPLEQMARQVVAYRKAAQTAKPLTDVTTNKVAAYTLVHCADSLAQAEANGIWGSVAWWYQNLAQFTLDWELVHLSEAEKASTFPLMKPLLEGNIPIQHFHDADMLVVGDPERCLQKMKHYADLGVDQLICYVQFGHHSHESVMKTIELLGKEVRPELEHYVPRKGVLEETAARRSA